MDYIKFKEIFENKIKFLNLTIMEQQYQDFYNYMVKILEWNEKINVTAITNEEEFIIKHFIDSLTIIKYINEKDKVLDIGTGAGFPGMCLKMFYEELDITLIDSVNKKLNVIKDVTKDRNYKKLEILHSRAEELAYNKNYREKYDIVTTRAVSNFSTILEYMIPFLKVGGIAICMKGPNFEEELKNAKRALDVLGAKIIEIDEIKNNNLERNNIIIKKVKKTLNIYPRKQGKPLKEPII